MTHKTFKREVAVSMLLVVLGLSIYGSIEPQALESAKVLVWPVFAFASGAFGLDAVVKQIKR